MSEPKNLKWFFTIGWILVGSAQLHAATWSGLLDPSRAIDWTGHAGVPGGIPNRTTVCATINAASYGGGTVNAAPAINSAIASCPAGQVVLLSSGTFLLSSPIKMNKSDVTLRGSGMGRTLLQPKTQAVMTDQNGLSSERKVLGGFNKGSTSITVSDASGIAAGTVIDLYQGDDPDFYWSRWGSQDRTGQYARVTAVSGSTLQLEDPLIWNFSLNPRFRYYVLPVVNRIGIEDLTINGDPVFDWSMIQLWNTYAAWVKGVETAWGNGNEHILLYGGLRNEIRDCYIHDTHSTSDGYGIVTMASSNIIYGHGGTTGLLVENNIFSGLWNSWILETEVGGVFSYNFSRDARYTGWPNYQVDDFNINHGPHGMMDLFEGNVAGGGIQSDGYHGSMSHSTFFRNSFTGQHADPNRTGNVKTVSLERFSYYFNVIGNVLGSSSWPRTTTGRYEMTGIPSYTDQAVIYRLGYPNVGNNYYSSVNPPSNSDDGGLDPKVKATLLRWGNFDYQSNATRWDASEVPSGMAAPSRTLPASFFHAAKPVWWPATVAWPPIGPDVSGLTTKIPAQLCYEAGTNIQIGTCFKGSILPPPTSACDVNGDASTNVSDVQLCANQVLQLSPCGSGDINKDGACTVVDVQKVVNAALGGTCVQ